MHGAVFHHEVCSWFYSVTVIEGMDNGSGWENWELDELYVFQAFCT